MFHRTLSLPPQPAGFPVLLFKITYYFHLPGAAHSHSSLSFIPQRNSSMQFSPTLSFHPLANLLMVLLQSFFFFSFYSSPALQRATFKTLVSPRSSLRAGIKLSPFHTWQSVLYATDVCMLLVVAALMSGNGDMEMNRVCVQFVCRGEGQQSWLNFNSRSRINALRFHS